MVQIFIRLTEVPLLLAFWGAQLYGEWLMLSAIPAYLAIGDGGFAGAACRDMTMKSGADDQQGALAVFQSTWVLLLAVSVVAFLLAWVFAAVSPLHIWLGFSAITPTETKNVLLLLVIHVLIGFQSNLLNGGFWVAGKYPTGMVLVATTQLLEFLGLGLAVILGGGPVQAATGYVIGRILGTSFIWIGQRKVISWLRYGFAHASFKELKRLAVPAFASLAFPLGNALNIQGMRLVVGLALSPAAVAVFVPLRTLSRLALQPQAVIYRLIEPELALAFGAEDYSLFRRIFAKGCQLSLWGCIGACFFVGVTAKWIFPVWTGGKLVMHWPTYIFLLISVLLLCIWGTTLVALYATNRHGSIATFYIPIYGVLALSLGYLGLKSLGLGGAAFALFVVEATMVLLVVNASLRMVKMQITQWLKIILRPPFEIVCKVLTGLHQQFMSTSK